MKAQAHCLKVSPAKPRRHFLRQPSHCVYREVEQLLDGAATHAASVVLISTIVTHHEIHREMMRKLAALAEERGARGDILLVAGGTQVTDALARECGMDAGFGRGTTGQDVASVVVRRLREREEA